MRSEIFRRSCGDSMKSYRGNYVVHRTKSYIPYLLCGHNIPGLNGQRLATQGRDKPNRLYVSSACRVYTNDPAKVKPKSSTLSSLASASVSSSAKTQDDRTELIRNGIVRDASQNIVRMGKVYGHVFARHAKTLCLLVLDCVCQHTCSRTRYAHAYYRPLITHR